MEYAGRKLKISLIAAIGRNRVIGEEGDMPWDLPDDLAWFKEKTMGHFVLMGRKTFLEFGRKLIRRKVIVLTRDHAFETRDAHAVNSFDEGMAYAALKGADELFIAGGGEIYKETISIADRMYLTLIHQKFNGDTFFPQYDEHDWKLISKTHHEKDDRHAFSFDFLVYDRK